MYVYIYIYSTVRYVYRSICMVALLRVAPARVAEVSRDLSVSNRNANNDTTTTTNNNNSNNTKHSNNTSKYTNRGNKTK